MCVYIVEYNVNALYSDSGEGLRWRRRAGVGGKEQSVRGTYLSLCNDLQYCVLPWKPGAQKGLKDLVITHNNVTTQSISCKSNIVFVPRLLCGEEKSKLI